MTRTILVNEANIGHFYAKAFDTREHAVEALSNIAKHMGYSPATIDIENGFGDIFIVMEQDIGLWVSFSISDHTLIYGSLATILEETFLGNDSPRFYYTVGQPSGKKIKAIDAANSNGTKHPGPHPLYTEWLAIHGNVTRINDHTTIDNLFISLRILINQLDDNISLNRRHDLCIKCRELILKIETKFSEIEEN